MPRRTIRVQVQLKRTVAVRTRYTIRPIYYGGYPQFIGEDSPKQLPEALACVGCNAENVTLDDQGFCAECVAKA